MSFRSLEARDSLVAQRSDEENEQFVLRVRQSARELSAVGIMPTEVLICVGSDPQTSLFEARSAALAAVDGSAMREGTVSLLGRDVAERGHRKDMKRLATVIGEDLAERRAGIAVTAPRAASPRGGRRPAASAAHP